MLPTRQTQTRKPAVRTHAKSVRPAHEELMLLTDNTRRQTTNLSQTGLIQNCDSAQRRRQIQSGRETVCTLKRRKVTWNIEKTQHLFLNSFGQTSGKDTRSCCDTKKSSEAKGTHAFIGQQRRERKQSKTSKTELLLMYGYFATEPATGMSQNKAQGKNLSVDFLTRATTTAYNPYRRFPALFFHVNCTPHHAHAKSVFGGTGARYIQNRLTNRSPFPQSLKKCTQSTPPRFGSSSLLNSTS